MTFNLKFLMLCLVVLVAIGCQNEREKENEGFRGKMEFITEKFIGSL